MDKVTVTIDENGEAHVEVDNAVRGHRCSQLAGMFDGLGHKIEDKKKQQFWQEDPLSRRIQQT